MHLHELLAEPAPTPKLYQNPELFDCAVALRETTITRRTARLFLM
jgi:hypothetical protein